MLEQEGQVRVRERPINATPANARVDHIYPSGIAPRIGSVAYCGFVKQTRWSGRFWDGYVDSQLCVVCVELAR